ncbi:MAG: translation initiation factor IF-2 [Bryobacteraceae bacterium]
MKKTRINELARELEVKPNKILELLPEFGVTEKKTHSSSIDDDVADQIRRRLGGVVGPREMDAEEAVEAAPETTAAPAAAASVEQEPVHPPVHVPPGTILTPLAAPARIAGAEVLTARRPSRPIRPPLASTMVVHETAASPAPPVVEPHPVAPPPAPAAPAAPAVAATPALPVPPKAPKHAGIPAKPLPPPRPGQILSGPRQPFPAARPAAPQKRPTPSQPPVPRQQPAAKSPAQPSASGGAPPRRTLAGQPAARPVVPPRPDLVARLKNMVPAQPTARPGMPSRPAATPVPGQPIYRGPIRPGQAMTARTGAGSGRMARGRPMHPTAASARGEVPPPPTVEQPRRVTDKRRQMGRDRKAEQEGKLHIPIARRESIATLAVNKNITVAEGITVKELSEKLGIKASMVIKRLLEKKIFASINQALDVKLAEEVARDFGAKTEKVSFEQEATQEIEKAEEEADLVKRAPVVTVMGHVDHGKTSLLDAIRSTSVAEREAGGITQHIGASQVIKDGKKIVFIDTPGHEAFTRMRARGAKVTDIVVLVVAADDGVMPQTLEAIDHAKAAGVPIVVAINKIDKADAQVERIKQQLSDRGLMPEEWGGETVMVPVSAKTKQNLDLLLEMILLVAEMQDLRANPGRPGVGTVLEAKLDRGRGPVATVIVRNGTLRVGDYFISGAVFGKVRAMFDDRGQALREAGPSSPAEVLGLESLPEVGDSIQVVTDTAKAKQIVIYREAREREQTMAKGARLSLDQLHEQLKEGEVKELPVVLKADVGGTAEVLADTLQKLSNDKVRIQVLHAGVGAITETDVLFASASNAVIIGFNVRPERNAVSTAEREKVDIRLHTIIYELVDEMKKAMTGLLEPVFKEVYKGRAVVREVFHISKVGNVAGCQVQDGVLTRGCSVRLLRDNIVVHTGKLSSLKRFKNDASEVKSGFECGLSLENYNDFKPGDIIEAFVTERVAAEVVA